MNDDFSKYILKRFPKLYELSNDSNFKPLLLTGFQCGDGWFSCIWEFSYHIELIVKNFGIPIPRVKKIKQKKGRLTIELVGYDMKSDDGRIARLLINTQNCALNTCEICSKIAKLRLDIYKPQVLCQKHYNKRLRSYNKNFK